MSSKPLKLSFLFAILFMSLISDDNKDLNKAIVNQEKGLFLFVENKPLNHYIELGNIKAGMTFSGQYNELKKEIIQKCLKNYPGANGLIFNVEKDCSQATAIKFE